MVILIMFINDNLKYGFIIVESCRRCSKLVLLREEEWDGSFYFKSIFMFVVMN